MWHSLKENGDINFYDVEWPDGTVETDVPAKLLEKVKDSDDPMSEAHPTEHGVEGYKEDSLMSEKKYKKKSKKKKARKSKRNKHKLFPYFYGINARDNGNYYEAGLDGGIGGGFGDGGE